MYREFKKIFPHLCKRYSINVNILNISTTYKHGHITHENVKYVTINANAQITHANMKYVKYERDVQMFNVP